MVGVAQVQKVGGGVGGVRLQGEGGEVHDVEEMDEYIPVSCSVGCSWFLLLLFDRLSPTLDSVSPRLVSVDQQVLASAASVSVHLSKMM